MATPAKPVLSYAYDATVLQVIDGDTVKVQIDLGFHVRYNSPLRLARINAAEHGTTAGDAATAFLKSKLPVGAKIMIESKELDKYGRVLAEIFLGDVSINDLMVSSGNAKPYSGRGPRP